ncbi:hypothetical protein DK847_00200 [Aestuariivirga litoralis]|uniref:Uncharacterized protein n=1 Tax=Aestuariivirga litoralis TaxID=2650924 RepID=A0A2W2BDH0_9HYPH|nr:hypothetical protein [Aestuariivirga litoralis]PZF78284.1 hypothetical protein DK847_00200 [Aestuariivirga litoralis]
MKPVTAAAAVAFVALFTVPALANPPKFTASCPTGITVKSNGSGKVKINGTKATVKTFSNKAWEASANGVSIDFGLDGSELSVTYTGKGGANGICQVTSGGTSGAGSPAGSNAAGDLNGVSPKDQQACLAAVSNTANNGDVDVLDAYSSEANNQVIVGVGSKKAKWQCLVKNGRVANVMSMSN